jgi:hypothetical protein
MKPRKRIVPGRRMPVKAPVVAKRPKRPKSDLPSALGGITVLDLSTVGPGTRCTRILADYGARVIKVGAPPRRAGVQVEPAFYAYSARRNFRQVRIDLKEPEGRDAFLKLAKLSDVVVESYRPGVVKRLGIDFESVRRVNPRIIYVSTSGFGQSGPAAQWAGHAATCTCPAARAAGSRRCPARRSRTVRPAACTRRSRSWRRCSGATRPRRASTSTSRRPTAC